MMYAVRAVLLGLLLSAGAACGDEINYANDIKPILATKCFACHGALKQEAGLRLDAAQLIRAGGDSGPAITPGSSQDSLLIARVAAENISERMPPEGEGEALSAEQLAKLRLWIDQGAPAPEEPIPPDPRQHWAYQPPTRANTPPSIDAFLAVRHAEAGLTPAPFASKEVLLRRVYLDLIGLPPSREEVQAFMADDSPQAYERVVDRLLESPQYGERWARHWMDVWRYSDWAGFGNEIRYSQRHIWRWRDWIVESLNADKGYDQMILEMLAADELAPGDEDALRATGYLARNWYKFDRNSWLDDVVDHTSKAFLGITAKCARCHDHKYDPISQREFYALRAIFEPYDVRTDPAPGEPDLEKDGLPRVYDAKPDAATYLFTRGDPKRPVKDQPIAPGVPAVVSGPDFEVAAVTLPLESYYPALREYAVQDMIAQAQAAVTAADAELAQSRNELTNLKVRLANASPAAPSSGAVFVDDEFSAPRPDTWKVVRGEWEYTEGRLVQKQVVSGFSPLVTIGEHPRDFVARLTFTPTGGNVYRSVGLSFDWVEDRDFQAVYLSAKDGGSTVSAFHRRNGADVYPGDAIAPQPIKVGQKTELEVQVRGDVLNVRVDGRLKLAYRLPVARQAGKFALWTYDASAEFHQVHVAELPVDVTLTPPTAKLTVDASADPALQRMQAEHNVALAEKKRLAAQAKLAAVQARVAAERAKHTIAVEDATSPAPDEQESLALAAGRAERQAALAEAEVNLLAAQQEAERARAEAKPDDEASQKRVTDAVAKVQAAEKTLQEARTAAEQPSANYQPLGPQYPKTSTGRRLALARWIADRRNPLTARVAVNHVWLRHFGQPLVEHVDDFGLRSPRPPLAGLLDYLALELMDHGWSLKHVHRLIVTSDAYQRSSSAPSISSDSQSEGRNSQAIDPDNHLLWRANIRRMEAEVVRDSLLAASGELDLTMGGPDLDHTQGMTSRRRSIYFRHARERQMEFLLMFDAANPEECYRRRDSIRPQQTLALMNSSLALAQSRRLAARLAAPASSGEGPDDASFIVAAFETILNRRPSEVEISECRQFLDRQAALLAEPAKLELLDNTANAVPPSSDPRQRARENLVLVLFNHNDFVTIR